MIYNNINKIFPIEVKLYFIITVLIIDKLCLKYYDDKRIQCIYTHFIHFFIFLYECHTLLDFC